LNTLLDEIGINEAHPLNGLLDTLGTLIHTYETEHHGIPSASGPEVLQFLMEEHGLSEADLPEIGSPNVVERYLTGKDELSVGQVRAVAQRFHVSTAAFI
jgi:HTH-type transcriptional regulator/antitoxin HigA